MQWEAKAYGEFSEELGVGPSTKYRTEAASLDALDVAVSAAFDVDFEAKHELKLR